MKVSLPGRDEKPVWKPLAGMAALALLVTLAFFSGLPLLTAGYQSEALGWEDTHILAGEVVDGRLAAQDGRVAFEFSTGLATKTLGIVSTGGRDPAKVSLQVGQPPREGEGYLGYLMDEATLLPGGRFAEAVLHLRNDDASLVYRLSIECGEEFALEAPVFNQNGFAFNLPVFALLLLCMAAGWLAVRLGWHKTAYSHANRRHRLGMAGVVVFCVLVACAVAYMARNPAINMLVRRNMEDLGQARWAQYYQLFAAFENGQVALPEPAPAYLAAIANPYQDTQREAYNYLWDFVYYEGSYYCYFGPAPMLLFFPVFWLTGQLPSPVFACLVPAVAAIVCGWGALRRLLGLFAIQANLLLLALAYPALVGGGMVYLLVACADTYAQPYLWALAGLMAFLWFLLAGLAEKRTPPRLALLCMAGAAVVVIAASRPSVVLLALAFGVPVLLRWLRDKERAKGAKIWDIAALGVPVALGAAWLMWYNWARFGSVFDFGVQYQLTVWDNRLQGMRLEPVWPLLALGYFLFWPLQYVGSFPFVGWRVTDMHRYGAFFFNSWSGFAGILNFPLFWGLFATGKTLRGATALKKGMYIGALAVGGALAWVNFCVSNLEYRYTTDLAMAVGLIAVLVLAEVLSCKKPGMLYKAACAGLAASFVLGLLLCFVNERNYIYENNPQLYIAFERWLRIL